MCTTSMCRHSKAAMPENDRASIEAEIALDDETIEWDCDRVYASGQDDED